MLNWKFLIFLMGALLLIGCVNLKNPPSRTAQPLELQEDENTLPDEVPIHQ